MDAALLEKIFHEAPGFMALTRGPEHRVVLVNDRFKAIIRRDPTGQTVAEAIPEFLEQGIVAMLDEVGRTRGIYAGRGVELTVSEQGVSRRLFVDFTSQALTSSAEYPDILCLGYDLTNLKAAEERTRRLEAELAQVSRLTAMGLMAGTLAHELNQPLAAATNYLSFIRKRSKKTEGSDVDTRRALQALEGQIERAGEIIRRARRGIAGVPAAADTFKFAAALDEVLSLLQASGALIGISLDIEIDPSELTLLADRIQLEQVLTNLLRNASHALSGRPDACIQIVARSEGEHLLLTVDDNGPGFGAHAERAFELLSSSHHGLGLGLSISRTIIEAHGGTISLGRSGLGGASIRIMLPRT